ncbi:winged helix-turn-helix domain-containing protein [Micromonospora sp. RTGN7]|uniref:winged helix-turn-helix domain-containing protein n=1 Tax=Micromonospora sp. RTGN7 TaxID=3016526 RepID=UPI0029FF5360|nr:winged helix-turn-helix domain-containing protein [Micromonospora sp. RTGN7]
MSGIAPLAIGIASSGAQRRQLAELFGGTEAFLIVSSVDQARQFLGVVRQPDAAAAAVAAVAAAVAAAALAAVAVPARAAFAEATAPTCPPIPELSVDSDRRVLCWRGREVELTPLEHDLVRCLVGTPGHVWTYQRLHREVWGTAHLGRGSDMHSVVRRLRSKLARLGAAATIHSVRGIGFRLAAS